MYSFLHDQILLILVLGFNGEASLGSSFSVICFSLAMRPTENLRIWLEIKFKTQFSEESFNERMPRLEVPYVVPTSALWRG